MSPATKPSQEWRDYEDEIFEFLKDKAGPTSTVDFDQMKAGRLSGVARQVDIWVQGPFAGEVEETITALVDCKHYTRNVDVKAVEAFMGLVVDVGADIGILVTSKGYSDAAHRRASGGGFKLHVVPRVVVVATDEWDEWDATDFIWQENDEPAVYAGAGFDFSPYGPAGCVVTYSGADKPSGILESAEGLWDDEDGRRAVVSAIFEHSLGRAPDPEAVESFLEEYGDRIQAGYEFEFTAGEVAHMAW